MAWSVPLFSLARPDIRTAPLAGGDTLIGSGDDAVEAVVDLQSLGLDDFSLDPSLGVLSAKALVTRARLADLDQVDLNRPAPSTGVRSPMPPKTRRCASSWPGARRWGGNVQRNRATLGGALVAAAANDPLVVWSLACDVRILALLPRRLPDPVAGRVHPPTQAAPGRTGADYRRGRAAAARPADRLRAGRRGAYPGRRGHRGCGPQRSRLPTAPAPTHGWRWAALPPAPCACPRWKPCSKARRSPQT